MLQFKMLTQWGGRQEGQVVDQDALLANNADLVDLIEIGVIEAGTFVQDARGVDVWTATVGAELDALKKTLPGRPVDRVTETKAVDTPKKAEEPKPVSAPAGKSVTPPATATDIPIDKPAE